MGLSVTASLHDIVQDNRGTFKDIATLTVTGLTGGSSNTVPHGLPRTPRRVWFTAIGSGANVANCSLDTATAAAGFDATNIYIFTPNAVTTVLVYVEY
jgi:hypothetical protein